MYIYKTIEVSIMLLIDMIVYIIEVTFFLSLSATNNDF